MDVWIAARRALAMLQIDSQRASAIAALAGWQIGTHHFANGRISKKVSAVSLFATDNSKMFSFFANETASFG